MKRFFAILLAKFAIKICRVFGKGGTSLPGKIAKNIYPTILEELASHYTTIVVTGTNGKTTTTAIIDQILKDNNIDHIVNKSGANLEKGIITTFITGCKLNGKPKKATVALIESDEAAFKNVSDKILPNVVLVTNFFKDQLDRFGEVNHTVELVKEGISKTPNSILVLNADDHRTASLGVNVQNKVIYYGIKENDKVKGELDIANQANYCPFCKSKYKYNYVVYSHMGGFECPNCGFKRPIPDVEVVGFSDLNTEFSEVEIRIDGEEKNFNAKINLPGVYNVYNALAAVGCNKALKLPTKPAITALKEFDPGFGRMESVNLDGKIIKIILIKNPTGFNEVINHILTDKDKMQIMFIINDNDADGTDISWLWDAHLEKLTAIEPNVREYYTAGQRAEDMALRLKYAGLDNDKINIRKNIDILLDLAIDNMKLGDKLYILPTYTAMLETRELLQKRFNMIEFWK